jgi:signal transduction histidine kinase
VLATTKGLLKNKPVELITEIDERLPEISGDRRRIRQVLLNVLSNAARFTEKGSITVTAKKEDDKIHITVRDTGVGIAPADQSLVFESFRQANHELNEGSGTGLGMPISKYFTEAHGGKIWFESKQGVGTTFHIVLPIQTQLAKTADMPRV